ncbi:hypothetical protein D1632_14115 [Chryseobacterium nematophagum]|uniref:Uncharacterized protein n=1 Tax=Chryseobacterium nematophagum TaxID=2305228 RepID=A0A3M7L7I6_9FLAO|nr:hypothetical protein [Chryseobacterium nematophagum]RMZ58721.1 hypothetical protein D1632_14115 [Chryseobacterium nematophagum]
MKKLYTGALTLCAIFTLYSQKVIGQKDIKSSSQDFLSQATTTLEIPKSFIPNQQNVGKIQNYGYDFHLIKLNQQGEQVREKYFSGNQNDFLSATGATQDEDFFLPVL